jgi:dihydrofolate reductase
MSTASGKVVVNRAMSLDGFIAGPGDEMGWIVDLGPKDDAIAKAASATGAMLIGRRTWDVGARMETDEPGSVDYPFTGPTFVLTHRPLDAPNPDVTILSGDIGDAVATALDAAGTRNLELLGADVASQAIRQGLVDEILVYVLPVVLGGGVPFSPAGSVKVDLEPIGTEQSGATTILRFRVRK